MPRSESNRQPIPFPQRDRADSTDTQGARAPNNLPVYLTHFIGRRKEVDEVCSLIRDEDVRLLTLTGPGGVGKTRLALRAAEELLGHFEDGVFFVDLASVADPSLVISTIAQALGVTARGSASLTDSLTGYLSERDMLLVLDNFEQVVEAASQVAALFPEAPGLRIVVTSRTALQLYGEHEYPVLPMGVPGSRFQAPSRAELITSISALNSDDYDGVELFVARAREVQTGFALTEANAPVIVEICDRLDGLPLALELAAARIRLFTPKALLAKLDKRLVLLTGGARDLPARQRTLRATIDWSYDLLDDDERALFARLAVFAGGCTQEAVEAIAGGISERIGETPSTLLDALTSLVAKSLLRSEGQTDGEPRFWMLATIREYASEKLDEGGDLADAQQAHARYFLALAEAARDAWLLDQYNEWLPRLDLEHDNMRAALRRSLDSGENEVGLRLANALTWYWNARGYLVEGLRWLEEALASSENLPESLRADTFMRASTLALYQSNFARTKAFAEESLNLHRSLGDKVGTAKVLSMLGVVAAEQEDYSLALFLFDQSLAVWRELEHSTNVGMLLGNLCFLAVYEGDYERAISYGEESVASQRNTDNRLGKVGACINLGLAFLHKGDYSRGTSLLAECLTEAEALSSRKDVALSHTYLGLAALSQGDHTGAAPHYKESLRLSEELGNRFGIARSLVGLAGVAMGEGDARRAVILSSAAQAHIVAARLKPVPAELELHERTQASARKKLGQAAVAEAWARGEAMTQAEGIAFALRQGPAPAPVASHVEIVVEPDVSSSDELSSREIEVLRLVAAGLTNKDIAEQLVLSPRTVQAHLYRIFNKLDVTTRSGATRYAIDHQMT